MTKQTTDQPCNSSRCDGTNHWLGDQAFACPNAPAPPKASEAPKCVKCGSPRDSNSETFGLCFMCWGAEPAPKPEPVKVETACGICKGAGFYNTRNRDANRCPNRCNDAAWRIAEENREAREKACAPALPKASEAAEVRRCACGKPAVGTFAFLPVCQSCFDEASKPAPAPKPEPEIDWSKAELWVDGTAHGHRSLPQVQASLAYLAIKAELAQAREEIERLRAQSIELADRVFNRSADNARLNAECAGFSNVNARLRAELAQTREEVERLKKSFFCEHEDVPAVTALRAEVERLKARVTELLNVCAIQETTNIGLHEMWEREEPPLRAEVEEAKRIVAAHQTEENSLRAELAAKDAEIAKLETIREKNLFLQTQVWDLDALCADLKAAREKAVEKERMVDAAISVLAMSNTRDTLKGNKLPRENPYWTLAQDDVEKAILREIDHREAREKAEAEVKRLEDLLVAMAETARESTEFHLRQTINKTDDNDGAYRVQEAMGKARRAVEAEARAILARKKEPTNG